MKSKQIKIINLVLFVLLTLWLAGIIYPLIFRDQSSNNFLQMILKKFYSGVCHQEASKLYCSGGHCALVCYRCLGIYSGALVTSAIVMFYLFNTPGIKWFFIALSPMLVDVLFTTLGIYTYNSGTAFFTGFIFGSACFLYIHEGILKLFNEINNRE